MIVVIFIPFNYLFINTMVIIFYDRLFYFWYWWDLRNSKSWKNYKKRAYKKNKLPEFIFISYSKTVEGESLKLVKSCMIPKKLLDDAIRIILEIWSRNRPNQLLNILWTPVFLTLAGRKIKFVHPRIFHQFLNYKFWVGKIIVKSACLVSQFRSVSTSSFPIFIYF